MKFLRKQQPAILLVVADRGHPGRLTCLKLLSGGNLPREYDRLEVIEVISSTCPVVAKLSVNHGKSITAEVRENTLEKGAVVNVEFVISEDPTEWS